MATQRQGDEHVQRQDTTGKVLKRRGILAAAGAMVAGIAIKQTSQPVAATTGGTTGGALILGANALFPTGSTDNTATNLTRLINTNNTPISYGSGFSGDAFLAAASGGGNGVTGISNLNGTGVYGAILSGDATSTGVIGSATNGIGVRGYSNLTAVQGSAAGDTSTNTTGFPMGVRGGVGNNGYGVYGQAGNGTGVTGAAIGPGGNGVNGIAVGGIGVLAQTSTGMYGVYGISGTGNGVWGEAGTGQGSGGVIGVSRHAGAVGFQALAVSPATYAGFFVGTVSITGSLGVSGGKFAVVKGQDGQYRGMYAVESPECWFEDFGESTLVNGKADVKLDPLFAQHVHTDKYHVFLTEHGENNSLHIASRAATGFAIEADNATLKAKGKSAASVSSTFSWRVVAKRNDIKGERMPVWEMPAGVTVPDPPKFDPILTAPAAPVPPASIPSPQPAPSPVAPPASASPVVPAPNPLPPSRP